MDAGGYVVAEARRNLKIILDEKTRKIEKYRDKYPKWWLILIDRIGLIEDEVNQLNEMELEHTWDKIILVNPRKPESGIEVYPRHPYPIFQ